MTSESYDEDDLSGIVDLIEVIKLQPTGPPEAARALRKKLKYGSPHRQVRALNIIDGLLQNAGGRFQRAFADEPLLERLRLLPRDEVVDADVRNKCQVLFIQWANAYKDTPGLGSIAQLYRELPKSQRPQAARQRVLQRDASQLDSDEELANLPSSSTRRTSGTAPKPAAQTAFKPSATLTAANSPLSSSKLSKKKDKSWGKGFNLAKEKDNITNCLAQSSIASTNLLNGLQLINRENERVSQNPEVLRRFETCKQLRRKILTYIQYVESDEWIGSLVNANDELVKALTAYEIMDKSISDDSDSDAWEQGLGSKASTSETAAQLAGLKMQTQSAPAKPPRPGNVVLPSPQVRELSPASGEEEEDDDDENPFGDSHAAATPGIEKGGMTWGV